MRGKMKTPKLLFFFLENEFCRKYFHEYVAKYDDATKVYNLTQKDPESLDMAGRFNVLSAPTLIMLDSNGNQAARWEGGTPPNVQHLRIEVGLAREYARRNEEA